MSYGLGWTAVLCKIQCRCAVYRLVRTGSKMGISPLMLAAMNGHTAAVKLLLDMGSDINAQVRTSSLCAVCRFLLCATAATAVARHSNHNSVCPSGHHTGGSVKNGASQNHRIFTVGCLEDSSFRISKVFPSVRMESP